MKFNYLKPRSFFTKLMLSHLVIIFISLTVIGFMFGYLIQNYYFGLRELEATNNGRRIAALVSENISEGSIRSRDIEETAGKINTIARSSNMDIGLMNARGEMLINAPTIRDFDLTLEDREINHILDGNALTKKIMGPEQRNLLMVMPVVEDEDGEISIVNQTLEREISPVGAIIIQTSLGGIATTINNIIRLIMYSFLVAIAAAIILSIPFAKRFTRPLEAIQQSALDSAEGHFRQVEIPDNSSIEIEHLVNTFNYAVQQINETMEKQKQLEKIRKEFVTNVSHEFRAPLTSIKGFIEIIEDNNLPKDKVKEYNNIMYKDAVYLEKLLSDLLKLGKLESKELSLELEDVYPETLITRAVESMKNKLAEKDINLQLNISNDLPIVKVDVNRMHQVMLNLLDNAVTYSPYRGKIKINVKLLEKRNDAGVSSDEYCNRIRFSIKDEGPGIPKEEQENIWGRFYKTDSARTREQKNGSGLGLAIVKEIILKHGGKVNIESTPGEGSIFSFVI